MPARPPGTAEAKFDTETRVLTWTVTYADLTGPALGAHFHGPSEAGKNAGIVLPFKTVQSPIEGSATLTENQAADLLAGKWYANVHTAANPGGELRGQMMKCGQMIGKWIPVSEIMSNTEQADVIRTISPLDQRPS